jgi:tetratricopeptide (TPR) repeat protein
LEQEAARTLKRLRTSGPLIIEEAMKNKDQMGEIIGQAVDGHVPEMIGSEAVPKDFNEIGKEMGTEINESEPRPSRGETGEKRPPRVSSVVRLNPNGPRPRGSGSLGNFADESSPNGGNGKASGPSRVLANASGLKTGSQFGLNLRVGLLLLTLFVSLAGYLLFREKILGTSGIGTDGRELRSPQELSDDSVREGQKAEGDGGFDVAIGHYQRALQLTPRNPAALFLLAHAYAKTGRLDESLSVYADLLGVAPENLEARLQIATIHQSRNNWDLAYREYQRIIALDQNSIQASMALEAIESRETSQAGDEAARRAAVAARKRVNRVSLPMLPAPQLGQREIMLQPPRILAEAPIRPPAVLEVAQSTEQPDPLAMSGARKDLGLRYLNIHEYRAAIKEFLIALRLTPEDKDIYYFLASAYHGLKQFPEANDYYKRVDRGRYVQVAQSGAKRTEKAAADYRRNMGLSGNDSTLGPGAAPKQN